MVYCTIFVRPSWGPVGAKISWYWSRRACSFSFCTRDKVVLESSNGMCGFCGKGASEVVSKSGEGGSKLPGSEKLLYLLFYNRLFVDY